MPNCVHYKFASKLTSDMVKFDGLDITPRDLKRLIMFREKLKPWLCDLKISNAQTNQEYTDDDTHIPRNTSVIIRRVPVWGVKPPRKNVRDYTKPSRGSSKATVNLAEANASEEEKIKAMMSQSTHQYDPLYYVENPEETPPPGYTCFRCGKKGHYIKNCPTNGDPDFKPLPREKKSTGIPRSFMVEVDDPTMQGAMLTNTGSYAIPTIAAEAYAIGKKERPPFLPQEPTVLPVEDDWEPDELLCQLCEELMMDAAVIPCCGRSYCDDCIRTCLLDSNHECPTCHQSGVSPDSLTANKLIRQIVFKCHNKKGYSKRLHLGRAPFLLEPTVLPVEDDWEPDELLCPLCEELMMDAAIIPCCGRSYCDDCIRTCLLKSEEHKCPTCQEMDVSPDDLMANTLHRQIVNKFMKHPGYTKRPGLGRAQVAPVVMQPSPVVERPLCPPASRQQDPLMANVAASTAASGQVRQASSGASPAGLKHSMPTTGQTLRSNPTPPRGRRQSWETSKSLDSISSYSGSSYSTSWSGSRSRSRSRSHSRSRRSDRSRSRSRFRGDHESHARSPDYSVGGSGRRESGSGGYRSRSRSPERYRAHSPSKKPAVPPRSEGAQYREPPICEAKASYGRPVDKRNAFRRDQYRQWDGDYRGRYD